MRHPYTKDTRRPLLLRHFYWITPYWILGSAYRVQIYEISHDATFLGFMNGNRKMPFGHCQTQTNCAAFHSRKLAEDHALEHMTKAVKSWTDYSAECAVRRREMIMLQERGISDTPRRTEGRTQFVVNKGKA